MKKDIKFLVWGLIMPFIGTLLAWAGFVDYNRTGIINWAYLYCVLYFLNMYVAGVSFLNLDRTSDETQDSNQKVKNHEK